MSDSTKTRERTTSAQSSRSSSVSKSNRKARRAAKAKGQKGKQEHEANTLTLIDVPAASEPGPSTLSKMEKVPSDPATSFGEEDFIAFQWEEGEEEPEKDVVEDVRELATTSNDGDKGKGRARDDTPGRKRKHDEIDLNDGYANKKQRIDAASRRAPWAADVDWERCHNVAEMCVLRVRTSI